MDSENYRQAYWCNRIQKCAHTLSHSKLVRIKFSDLEYDIINRGVPVCIRAYTECKIIRKAMWNAYKANIDFSKMLEEIDKNRRGN